MAYCPRWYDQSETTLAVTYACQGLADRPLLLGGDPHIQTLMS